jgi:uncharacterized protein
MAPAGGVAVAHLTHRECLDRLASVTVGRIAVTVQALPVVLPVNFALDGEDVVFRTVVGTKLSAATARAIVAFEVDGWEPDGSAGWSVLVQGRASEVQDESELSRLRQLPLHAWAFDGQADRYVRIRASSMTGRQFSVTEAAEGSAAAGGACA